MNPSLTPQSRTARAAGILFLGGFLSYGAGSGITTALTAAPGQLSDPAGSTMLALGALLMLVNSGLVIGIGILLYPVLRARSRNIALGYLATRIFEGVLMAVGIVGILTVGALAAAGDSIELATSLLLTGNMVAYNVAMAGLGIGSLFFCALLYASRLVPRFLAAWGFVGYAVLAVGCVLELLGFTGAGLLAAIPGGLWEVFFAVWLIVKGFATSDLAPARQADAVTVLGLS